MLSVLPCSLGFVAAPNAVVHAAPHRPQRTAAPTAQAAPPAAGWKPKDTEKMPGVSGPVLRPHSNPDPSSSLALIPTLSLALTLTLTLALTLTSSASSTRLASAAATSRRSELDPPVLDPPVLDPPVLDPPVLDPPVLDPPVLDLRDVAGFCSGPYLMPAPDLARA
eukprot:scaffold43028_cov45-Phaeocystis_antarctica.AAC.2